MPFPLWQTRHSVTLLIILLIITVALDCSESATATSASTLFVSASTNNNHVHAPNRVQRHSSDAHRRRKRRLGRDKNSQTMSEEYNNCFFTCQLRRPEILYENYNDNYELEDDESTPVCIIDTNNGQHSYYTIHTGSDDSQQQLWNPTRNSDNHRYIEAGTGQLCVVAEDNGIIKDVFVNSLTKQIIITLTNHNRNTVDNYVKVVQTEHGEDTTNRELQQQTALSKTTGVKTILAVRIQFVANDDDDTNDNNEQRILAEPDESIHDIHAALFGSNDGKTTTSVVQQYQDMSHNQLQFIPATTNTNAAGVVDVKVPLPSSSNIESYLSTLDIETQLVPEILSATQQQQQATSALLLHEVYDRIIFCIPTGSNFQNSTSWTAFTYLNEPYSYYQQSRCTKLSVVIHELGHSFGFHHSGVVEENPYSDKTDYMGYAQNVFGAPRKAFNGHKHWISGWYDDNTAKQIIDITTVQHQSQHIRLLSYVDYTAGDGISANKDVVLVRLDQEMYIQYNRAKGYAIDVDEPDTVTITLAYEPNGQSLRLAALNSTHPSYTYTNHNERVAITVLLCGTTTTEERDVATITIFVNENDDDAEIDQIERCQTLAPTTSSPTITTSPSPSPSLSPSILLPVVRNSSPTLASHVEDSPTALYTSSSSFNNGENESALPVKTILFVSVGFMLGFFILLIACVYNMQSSTTATDDYNTGKSAGGAKTTAATTTNRRKRRRKRRTNKGEEDISETELEDGYDFDDKLRLEDGNDKMKLENASTSSSLFFE